MTPRERAMARELFNVYLAETARRTDYGLPFWVCEVFARHILAREAAAVAREIEALRDDLTETDAAHDKTKAALDAANVRLAEIARIACNYPRPKDGQ